MRLEVPSALVGSFDAVAILTYNADLTFYESVLLRQLGTCRTQIVLADPRHLAQAIGPASLRGQLRRLNRTYVAAPITGVPSAHAKMILLLSPTEGRLLIGSGNLSHAGYAGLGEVFTAYAWTPERPDDLPAFASARAVLDGLAQGPMLEPTIRARVAALWHNSPWLVNAAGASHSSPVRHNLEAPLGEQLGAELGSDKVNELVVLAPFHDHRCEALRTLCQRLRPDLTTVYIQRRQTSVDQQVLRRVLSKFRHEVRTVELFEDPLLYLHAKLFLARTPTRDVLLAGSPNCSTVALWRTAGAGNLEMANLLTGPRGVFDHLFTPLAISTPVGLGEDLEVELRDGPDSSISDPYLLSDVRWTRPELSGSIRPPVEAGERASLLIAGEPSTAKVALAHNVDQTMFSASLSDVEAAVLDGVAAIEIFLEKQGVEVGPAVPYQVAVLEAQDGRRRSAERLRAAASLELDDPEMIRLLEELEKLLVGDARSVWRTAGQDRTDAPEPTEGSDIAWSDIDWARVRNTATARGYLGVISGRPEDRSELAIYFESLSAALRELANPATEAATPTRPAPPTRVAPNVWSETEDDVTDVEDDVQSEGEGDVEDVDSCEEREAERAVRRQSLRARNLRIIRNFVKRDLNALERAEFRAGVGPEIVIPNGVLLDHLCWRAVTSHEDSAGALIDERLRLWELFWGDAARTGYLASLDAEESTIVETLFSKQFLFPLLISSWCDVWQYAQNESQLNRLRAVVRRVLSLVAYEVDANSVVVASRLMSNRYNENVTASDAADVLFSIAYSDDVDEIIDALASVLGVQHGDIEIEEVELRVFGSTQRARLRTTTPLTVESGRAALETWLGLEDCAQCRIEDAELLVHFDGEAGQAQWMSKTGEAHGDLGALEPRLLPWGERLDLIASGLEEAQEDVPAA